MTVYALTNLKGGSGKTTSAVALGEAMSVAGQSVLVIDLDPQSTLSRWIAQPAEHATRLLRGNFDAQEHIAEVTTGLHLVASDRSLARVEDLRASRLAARLERLYEASQDVYDAVLVDPPPSVGSIVLAVLMASDAVLAPVEASSGAVDGLGDTLSLIRRVGGASFAGTFACRVDVRTNLDKQVPELLIQEFGRADEGGKAFDTFIRETVQMREAQAAHVLPSRYAEQMTAVQDYASLAHELEKRYAE